MNKCNCNKYLWPLPNILKRKNTITCWGCNDKYILFSDECRLKFDNSLQQLNRPAILNNDSNDYMNYPKAPYFHLNQYFPLQMKIISSKNIRKPWITPLILMSIHSKQRVETKARNRLDQFITLYWRYRNLLTKLTRTTREQYNHNLLESSFRNSKKVWSNINSILGNKHRSQNTSIRLNGILVSEPEPIATTFKSYFNNIPATVSNNNNFIETRLQGTISK